MSLARIVRLHTINKHSNADALELVHVKGWQCVAKLGDFNIGDLAIYVEIDTWIPHEVAPFLSKGKEPRVYEGVLGERLRTVKLRGEISQGLLLPLSVLYNRTPSDFSVEEEVDVTAILGIQKWHAPIPTALAGEVWPWPSYIPKTDQENIQNVYAEMEQLDTEWIIEEKLDGSSCTIYNKSDGTVGICSRNWELKQNDANVHNAFILAAKRCGLVTLLQEYTTLRVAIQAELCGPGIQGNPYKLKEPQLFVFDVYMIDAKRYMTNTERENFLYHLGNKADVEIPLVPLIGRATSLMPLKTLLEAADGMSFICGSVHREGIVFKSSKLVDNKVRTFKVVSNQYLLRQH